MTPPRAATDARPAAARLRDRLFAPLRQRSLRFLIAGGLNTAVGLVFYPLLLWLSPWLRIHYMIALVIAQASCLCFAFTTYKLGVFRSKGNLIAEFLRFCSFYVANYAVNLALLPVLVEVCGIKPAIAQVGFNLVVIVTSYFWHSKVTFRGDPV